MLLTQLRSYVNLAMQAALCPTTGPDEMEQSWRNVGLQVRLLRPNHNRSTVLGQGIHYSRR